jgi:hypothetical protein
MGHFMKWQYVWVQALLLTGFPLFGAENQGELAAYAKPNHSPKKTTCETTCKPVQEPKLLGGYGYSGKNKVACPVNLFADASFVYWQASQDDMNLGWITNYPNGDIGGDDAFNTNLSGVNMDFDYHPGFRVGMGGYFGYDNWDIHAEYTWYHATNRKSISIEGAAVATEGLYPSLGFPAWDGFLFNSASGKWRIKMDIGDLDLGRSYYVGKRVVFHPTIGLRAAWITQSFHMNGTADSGFYVANQPIPLKSAVRQDTHSWGVGPKVSLDGKWIMGSGFRLFGNGEMDLLYTQYTNLVFKENMTNLSTGLPYVDGGGSKYYPVHISQSDISSVRAHLDLILGLGWGSHFASDKYYIDFTAGYEMQVFFNQNMFFSFGSSSMYGAIDYPKGNLYLQGLTISSSLDF